MIPGNKMSPKEAMSQAARAANTGNIDRAVALYKYVLMRVPGHPKAKKALMKLQRGESTGSGGLTQDDVNRVVNLLNSGQYEEAASLTNSLILMAPREALLHNILGMCLASLGQTKAGAASYRKAVKINPNYPEALGNLGTSLLELGQFEDAANALRKAIKLKPDLAEAHHSLGGALARLGAVDDAFAAYDKALALRPNYVNAMNSKGALLKDNGQLASAIELYQAGLRLVPDHVDLLVNLGYAQGDDDQVDLAVLSLGKALKLNPELSEVWYRLGVQQSQLGNTKSAIAAIDEALRLNPGFGQAYRTKTTLKKYQAGDPEIATMTKIFDANQQDDQIRLHLGFALGKVAEDIGHYAAAFEYWRCGNATRRESFDYDLQRDAQFFQRLKTKFDADYFASYAGQNNPTNQPVFVVGMMRSGTTLVEQILASHSQVFGAGELPDVTAFGLKHAKAILSAEPFDLGDFSGKYLHQLARHSQTHPRIVDKLPVNFLWIGMIRAAFPNAKIINMVRDPRDNCLSIFKNYFDADAHEYAYDLTELAEYYLLYRDLMDHWNAVLSDDIYTCNYEALTSDFEPECRKLLDHCGLAWEPAVLEFHRSKNLVKSASVSQVREKINTASVQSWKRYQSELQPLIAILQAAGRL